MPIDKIAKFENQNKLAINVFGYDTPNKKSNNTFKQPTELQRINLMLMERDERKHYTWIKDFNKLLYDQTKH